MNRFGRFAYQKASSLFYRATRFIDKNLWMPSRVSDTLDFRAGWKSWGQNPSQSVKAKLWIHGASVGELEDLAAFFLSDIALHQAGVSASQVMVTASSVSTKSRLLQWKSARPFLYCGPIPPDSTSESREFLAHFAPENLLLSHNDFWPNLFLEWRAQKYSKTFFWYFKPKTFSTHRKNAFAALNPLRIDRHVIGNLRRDRILSRIETARSAPHALGEWQAAPSQDNPLPSILVGSCRVEDARIIAQLDARHFTQRQWVVMPHHSEDPEEVAQISQWLEGKARVIATQGILLEAYQGFDLAWVGGGFSRSGLHNALEPLAWGVPVICGPNTAPQLDTATYIQQGSLKTFGNAALISAFLDSAEPSAMKTYAATLANHLSQQGSGVEKLAKLIRAQISF